VSPELIAPISTASTPARNTTSSSPSERSTPAASMLTIASASTLVS
jgi:hypothetical protein